MVLEVVDIILVLGVFGFFGFLSIAPILQEKYYKICNKEKKDDGCC